MSGSIFERVEMKYIITPEQKEKLLAEIMPHLVPDPHGESSIFSLYLDTDDYRMIRYSLLGEAYKEKLRVRSYGLPKENGDVFIELKKKYKGRVYKRRVKMTGREMKEYLRTGRHPASAKTFGEKQILGELDYAFEFYHNPEPKALMMYERTAFYVPDENGNPDPALRLTFDSHIRYSKDFSIFNTKDYGEAGYPAEEILPGKYLMEFKTDCRMPLWFAEALSRNGIVQSSFSKYGTAYRNIIMEENQFEREIKNYA